MVFSGGREVPISEIAKQDLRNLRSHIGIGQPRVQRPGETALVFVAAFDGTLNDREFVASSEDKTVVAKLEASIQLPDSSSTLKKVYVKGPGCRFGPSCWIDAATGYSSTETAEKMLLELEEFVAQNPKSTELRVVTLGFSRGAATARHFLNLVYDSSKDGFLHETIAAVWSNAMLFDTVSTGQEQLRLGLPPNVELAIHYVAANEARPLFTPVLDTDEYFEQVAFRYQAPINRRVWTVQVPGSHSDIGDSYLQGAGFLVTANAHATLMRLGLAPPRAIEACPEGNEKTSLCRLLDEGVHDSRGFIDRFLWRVHSPYSCTFERKVHKRVKGNVAEAEAIKLIQRIRSRYASEPPIGIGTEIQTRSTENYVLEAQIAAPYWRVIHPTMGGLDGYDARVTREPDKTALSLLDPINAGTTFEIPEGVFEELKRRGGKGRVELNLSQKNKVWWFVENCVPTEE